jgi:hypothetical protein
MGEDTGDLFVFMQEAAFRLLEVFFSPNFLKRHKPRLSRSFARKRSSMLSLTSLVIIAKGKKVCFEAYPRLDLGGPVNTPSQASRGKTRL